MAKRILTTKDAPISTAELRLWRRDRLRWKQTQAAKFLGVSLKAYQNWEQGKRNMRHPVAMRKLMKQAEKAHARRAVA